MHMKKEILRLACIMTKELALQNIRDIMQQCNLSLNDVSNYLGTMAISNFDLLCVIDGKKKRVSFPEGKELNPIGIFPFKSDNSYLEFEQRDITYRQFADERRLPTESFYKKINAIRVELNESLRFLQKPVLYGSYFAISDYHKDANFIVFFDERNAESLPSDFYNNDEQAQIRYWGTI